MKLKIENDLLGQVTWWNFKIHFGEFLSTRYKECWQ